jgi:hypothetical protein
MNCLGNRISCLCEPLPECNNGTESVTGGDKEDLPVGGPAN